MLPLSDPVFCVQSSCHTYILVIVGIFTSFIIDKEFQICSIGLNHILVVALTHDGLMAF